MSYRVGIDLGTAFCAAAVCRPELAAPPELVPLAPGATVIPSVVYLDAGGTLLFGEDAERRAPADPGRVARRFTRRIGDGTPLWIGGTAITADELAARFVARVVELVAARLGGPPSRIALSHPAGWGPHRLASLRAALDAHGFGARGVDARGVDARGPVQFVPEPQAAVLAHVARERLEPGAAVAVYDLGGGSLDAAVVRVLAPDRFALVGRPEEIELGFVDFDEVVFEHVRSTLGPAWDALDPTDPAVLSAVARLRRACVAAKEALSSDTDVLIPVTLPGVDTGVRLARAEFEEMIRPAVGEATDALQRTIGSAGLDPSELAAVLLVGGSARVPLVTQEVSARLGRPVTVAADPKGIVAIGTALAAADPEPDLRTASLPVVRSNVTPLWVRQPLAGSPAGQPAGSPAGLHAGRLAGAPPPVAPPPVAPLTTVPPPPVSGARGGRRRLLATVAAAVLAAAVVAGGATLASWNTPPGADADPTTAVTPSVRTLPPVRQLTTEPTQEPTTAEQAQPSRPPAARPPAQRSTQPPTRRTTTIAAATTTPPATSSATPSATTATEPPTTQASPPTSAGAAGAAGAGTGAASAQAGAR